MGIVYTQGCYDVFHAGHVNFLRRSAKFGDVWVALLTDDAYLKYRGYPVTNDFKHRKTVLEGCRYVGKVMPTDNTDTVGDIKRINADIITIGGDWLKKDIWKQWMVRPEERFYIDERLIFIPYTQGLSSTNVKEKIKKA